MKGGVPSGRGGSGSGSESPVPEDGNGSDGGHTRAGFGAGAGRRAQPPLDEGLIALATQRPVAVTMIVCCVVVFGWISLRRLPLNLMPDISYPTLTVRTEYPGASPLDVETRIARRLEEVLSQVRSLRRVTSVSRAESCDVILEFAWDTDMSLATMDVREKVDQARLPDEATTPTILRYDPTLDPIIQLGLYALDAPDDQSSSELIDLRIRAEEKIERELLGMDGVAAVRVLGGLEREVRIAVNQESLKAKGLSITRISERLKAENLNQASGMMYEGQRAYVVRTVNEFRTVEEIGEIGVVSKEGVPVKLREVATITASFKEPEVLTRFNGRPCVKIDVHKEADANLVEVADLVRRRVLGTPEEQKQLHEALRREREEWLAESGETKGAPAEREDAREEPGEEDGKADETSGKEGGDRAKRVRRPRFIAATLPDSVELKVMADQSTFIKRALANVVSTALWGGVLAVGVLYLFLRRLLFTAIVALSIPVSVVATFVGLHLFDVSLNMMSLGGLALGVGMLVDNSIVVLESIFRCREEGDNFRVAAVRGSREVARAVTASTVTTVCVFFPIVFVEGIAGQVFRDQAVTVVLSLMASLLAAVYLIPALASRRFIAEPGSFDFDSYRRQFASGLGFAAWSRRREQTEAVLAWWRRASIAARAGLAAILGICVALVWLLFVIRVALEVIEKAGSVVTRFALEILAVFGRASRRLAGGFLRLLLRGGDRLLQRLLSLYEPTIRAALTNRPALLIAVAAAAWGSWVLFSRLGTELIPTVHQGEFAIDLRMPVGTRIETTDRVLRPLEREALGQTGALNLSALLCTIGVAPDESDIGDRGEHSAEYLVRLQPGNQPGLREENAKRELRRIFGAEASLASLKFENPVLFSFKTPIEVEVKGFNLTQLHRITNDVEAALRAIPELRDVKSNMASGVPELHLPLNRDLLARHDLSVQQVGELIRHKIQGEVPTYFSEADRKIGIRVRLREEDRLSLEDLREIIVVPELGLRLEDFATNFQVTEGQAEIRRVGHERAGVVTANLIGMDLGRVTEKISARLAAIRRPADFSVGFGGQKQEMDLALKSLLQALLLAIFLVYVVLAIQFESLVQPLVIIAAVPLAMLGVAPALWALGLSMSIISFIGMIVLAGIVVNNAIVLVDRINQLRARGLALDVAIVGAGMARLRPILMTTMTTVLGLLPLTGILNNVPAVGSLLGGGEGAEVRMPLAVTVIAGLVMSTLLTLFVVPVMYSLVASKRDE